MSFRLVKSKANAKPKASKGVTAHTKVTLRDSCYPLMCCCTEGSPCEGVALCKYREERCFSDGTVRKPWTARQKGYTLPGGKALQGETVAEVIIREFGEETGLAMTYSDDDGRGYGHGFFTIKCRGGHYVRGDILRFAHTLNGPSSDNRYCVPVVVFYPDDLLDVADAICSNLSDAEDNFAEKKCPENKLLRDDELESCEIFSPADALGAMGSSFFSNWFVDIIKRMEGEVL